MSQKQSEQGQRNSISTLLFQVFSAVLSAGILLNEFHLWKGTRGHAKTARQICFSGRLLLPVLTVSLSVATLVAILLFYRHMRPRSQAPLHAFAWDMAVLAIQWAVVPSIILAIVGLLYGIFLRGALNDAGQRKTNCRRIQCVVQRVFQSRRFLAVLCLIGVPLDLGLVWYMLTTPPRFYSQFLPSVIQGASDDYARARRTVKQLESVRDSDMAEGYTQAIDVLARRCRVDYQGEGASLGEMRSLFLSLEKSQAKRWQEHPLRWYALGEVYAMYAEQSRQLIGNYGLTGRHAEERVRRFAEKSESYFDKVWTCNSVLATRDLKNCVMRKKGNMLARLGRYEDALTAWNRANRDRDFAARSCVLWGLVLTEQASDAVAQGTEATRQAREEELDINDPSACSRIYANTALAQWIVRHRDDDALTNCLEAVVVQDDLINRLYFAYALLQTGRKREAEKYLRGFMTPVFPENLSEVITSPAKRSYAPGYLLWALADSDAPWRVQVARLYATLGEAREVTEFEGITDAQIDQLVDEAISRLKQNAGICFDFMLVQSTEDNLRKLAKSLRDALTETEPVPGQPSLTPTAGLRSASK